MAEKIKVLGLKRDFKKFLYFIDGIGNVCRMKKDGTESEILHRDVVKREPQYLYFIDRDGDVARSPRDFLRR